MEGPMTTEATMKPLEGSTRFVVVQSDVVLSSQSCAARALTQCGVKTDALCRTYTRSPGGMMSRVHDPFEAFPELAGRCACNSLPCGAHPQTRPNTFVLRIRGQEVIKSGRVDAIVDQEQHALNAETHSSHGGRTSPSRSPNRLTPMSS